LIDALNSINHVELYKTASMIEVITESNGKIYLMGNGGSAAIASHFSHNLCWDVSADRHYDDIFKIQLENLEV